MIDNAKRSVKISLLYTISTQLIVVIVGLVKTLVLPKVFDTVSDYGYWQVFMFYSSYLLLFTFGYHEGLYLIYGGKDFNFLPDQELKTSFSIHILIMLIITAIGCTGICLFTSEDGYRRFVFIMVLIKLLPSAIIEVFSRLFQCTSEFKKYSIYTIIDKIAFVVLMIALMIFKCSYYKLFIIMEVSTQIIVSVIIFFQYRSFFSFNKKKVSVKNALSIWLKHTGAGFKIIAFNYIAILATGYGRFLVEQFGDIDDYAYYSLGISILNFVILAISAFSIILYPTLKRIDVSEYSNHFLQFTRIMNWISAVLLLMYYPLVFIIKRFLSSYSRSIVFLPPLMGLTILKGVIDICITPFMKASRKEKQLLKVGIYGFVVNVLLSTPLYLITLNIRCVAYSSFVMMAVEYIYQEVIIHKEYNIKNRICDYIPIFALVIWLVSIELLSIMTSFFITLIIIVSITCIEAKTIKSFIKIWRVKKK